MPSITKLPALKPHEKDRLLELERAFALFNETSNQLTQAYEALQEQVAHLQLQLEKSDHEKRRVADRLARLLTLLPAGVIVLNDEDCIVEMNPSAQAILGEDALNARWPVVIEAVFASRNDAQELVAYDGKIFQLSHVTLDVTLGKILLIQDVTDARQLQDHINRHQRLRSMGEMAASLAHQIRTPLAAALLYVSQLSTQTMDEDKRHKFTHKVLLNLKHLEGLVRDMLQYAKGGSIGAGCVEVSALLREVALAVEQHLATTDSELVLTPVEQALWVRGDYDSLMTALQNLIVNAIDVVRARAKIRIYVQLDGADWVNLIVADQGPGIEAAIQEKIFEPFYTSRAKGTGLGLAVVRTIAEAHGGQCWVNSKVGEGARFGIRLPLTTQKGEDRECS
ncbi:sensor histidine kinase [Thiomicrospira microaerophila]|uniref:sensor histidine kinase n=1 Tax=Thiomicrospira microaerophila TaxID=406020 RepID=UPI0005C893AF|nr:HAMP domain-containing sensor histidine kinase [Thiomicrospira microaerophila]